MTNDNNEDVLTENNHIVENNNKSDLNRRDTLFENDDTEDKEKRVSNIRPECGESPETTSPKLNI